MSVRAGWLLEPDWRGHLRERLREQATPLVHDASRTLPAASLWVATRAWVACLRAVEWPAYACALKPQVSVVPVMLALMWEDVPWVSEEGILPSGDGGIHMDDHGLPQNSESDSLLATPALYRGALAPAWSWDRVRVEAATMSERFVECERLVVAAPVAPETAPLFVAALAVCQEVLWLAPGEQCPPEALARVEPHGQVSAAGVPAPLADCPRY